MSDKICGRCEHYFELDKGKRGYCYGEPPSIFVSGAQSMPPVVLHDRKKCNLFVQLPDGQEPDVKVKKNFETPGDAAKAKRNNR